ncbi:hypothetical protein N7493_004868 [Penicillium malachiteum]|uniref:6-phosphogluconate dehydrogenase NADP-binding domain-containing protein n=1 Tax=Penicillium malachiteum TaxID=1324776 RepID=A0AAD6MW12_9EURO|nr:hypothetical protein N7493_004868 [Penicillium malachiteum]
MTFTAESISVLGLGNMGTALASVFLAKGYPVTVWNRSIEKSQALVEKGAKLAKSPADCVQSSTIVLISLASDEVVRELLGRISTIPGCTVINFTTSRPQWAIEASDTVTNKLRAIGYLHGWINSVPSEVEDQKAIIRYSGSEAIFSKHKHIFNILGKSLWVSDDHRKICILENAVLLMLAGTCVGFLQSLAMAGAAGVDTVDFTEQALLPLMPIFQGLLLDMARRDQEDFHTMSSDSISVSTMLGLVSNGRETAEISGVSGRLLEGLHSLLRNAAQSGKSFDDISTLVKMIRRGSQRG